MRPKYSIPLVLLLIPAGLAAAEPCPPAMQAIARQVAMLRGVEEPFLPPCRFIASADVRRELDVKLRRDLPLPPELYLEALRRIGLIEGEPRSIYPRLLDFYSSQVLGFYEPATDEMVLPRNSSQALPAGESVWAHELAHAAQERRYHLPSRLLAMRENSDQQRAAAAIAEGDALLVMLTLGHAAPPDIAALRQTQKGLAAQVTTLAPPPGVPGFFVKDLIFPYSQGLKTVLDAFERGGWTAVDGLLARPPRSTAALLHPERGAPGGALSDALLPAPPGGWRTILTDTLGEWALGIWLGGQLPAERATALAAGWDGDRLRLVMAPNGRWGLALTIRGRDEAAARNLGAAMSAHLPRLLVALGEGQAPTIEVERDGRLVTVRAGWPPALPSAPTP